MKKVTMSDIPRTQADMAPLGSGGLMTGTQVWRQAILNPDDSSNFNFAIVAFDAGSRNKFHIHSGDQILVITEGGERARLPPMTRYWKSAKATSSSFPLARTTGTERPTIPRWLTSPSPLRAARPSRPRRKSVSLLCIPEDLTAPAGMPGLSFWALFAFAGLAESVPFGLDGIGGTRHA